MADSSSKTPKSENIQLKFHPAKWSTWVKITIFPFCTPHAIKNIAITKTPHINIFNTARQGYDISYREGRHVCKDGLAGDQVSGGSGGDSGGQGVARVFLLDGEDGAG